MVEANLFFRTLLSGRMVSRPLCCENFVNQWITSVKFHDLRATFITNLLARGESLARVMAMVGQFLSLVD